MVSSPWTIRGGAAGRADSAGGLSGWSVGQTTVSAATPSSLSEASAQPLESPVLKEPVAFPVVAEADTPTGSVLWTPTAGCADRSPVVHPATGGHLALRPHRAATGTPHTSPQLFLQEKGQRAAISQGTEGAPEAQRFQVSLAGSGRTSMDIQGEGAETLPHEQAAARANTSTDNVRCCN